MQIKEPNKNIDAWILATFEVEYRKTSAPLV